MDIQVSGKRYLVAASSEGLGYGIARALVRDGASVALGGRRAEALAEAAASLRALGPGEVVAHPLDAANGASIADWVGQSVKDLGGLDGLVVNAGGPPAGKFDDFNDAAWENAFQLTLMSAVRMIREALPVFRAQGSGSILTITSTSIKEPIDVLLLSNVFRSGVVSLVKSLSGDLAREGIRINNLVPGRIDTTRVRQLDSMGAAKAGISPAEQQTRAASVIPLGRYGTTEEFGDAGAFLLSPAASFITGATYLVDGGMTHTVW